ncbi:flagellar hook-basal body complex protein FliE [Photobacterium proteolyticum]|uniref:Flagellar hook-basal body complex protein FliE n=1 Tax=Photobacterium proteolyticum TaxID=1903952 RepID=A0A1Q9GVH8_9GAMM|nr:flagellar hook-basal body complex protein FliE [Photobacterium proteolyticum]OLQ79149.1 flagellar hook-basal body complex protein FliE [Photobacterium proteolyticum]
MANNSMTQLVSSEQLMLEKMQNMQHRIQADFVVSENPIDQQVGASQLNPPLSFAGAMHKVLNVVNSHQSEASAKMTAVETGKSDDLVGAMIASQKASLSFSALMQVRNKVVMSFEDIMKMPV